MSQQSALGYYCHLFIIVFDRSTGRAQLSLPLFKSDLGNSFVSLLLTTDPIPPADNYNHWAVHTHSFSVVWCDWWCACVCIRVRVGLPQPSSVMMAKHYASWVWHKLNNRGEMKRIATGLTMSAFVFCFLLVKQVICACVPFCWRQTFNNISH